MRILHLTPYYAPSYVYGGVVRALEGLAEAQVAAGHSVRILTSDAANPGRAPLVATARNATGC